MAKYTRIEAVHMMKETGIVPVFYHGDIDICKQIVKACYDAGARVFEFTNRGDFAHEVFGELSKYVSKNLDGMILGIGSVIDPGTTSLYLQPCAHPLYSTYKLHNVATDKSSEDCFLHRPLCPVAMRYIILPRQ